MSSFFHIAQRRTKNDIFFFLLQKTTRLRVLDSKYNRSFNCITKLFHNLTCIFDFVLLCCTLQVSIERKHFVAGENNGVDILVSQMSFESTTITTTQQQLKFNWLWFYEIHNYRIHSQEKSLIYFYRKCKKAKKREIILKILFYFCRKCVDKNSLNSNEKHEKKKLNEQNTKINFFFVEMDVSILYPKRNKSKMNGKKKLNRNEVKMPHAKYTKKQRKTSWKYKTNWKRNKINKYVIMLICVNYLFKIVFIIKDNKNTRLKCYRCVNIVGEIGVHQTVPVFFPVFSVYFCF